jgi:hypothetical protein
VHKVDKKRAKRGQKEGKKCINTGKYTEWLHKDTKKRAKSTKKYQKVPKSTKKYQKQIKIQIKL